MRENKDIIIWDIMQKVGVDNVTAEKVFNAGYRFVRYKGKCKCCGKEHFFRDYGDGMYNVGRIDQDGNFYYATVGLCDDCYQKLKKRRDNADVEFTNECKFFED